MSHRSTKTRPAERAVRRHVLCIDVGGSHVKIRVSNRDAQVEFRSGRELTPAAMVEKILARVKDWRFHYVTLGYPGVVVDGRIVCDPANLGSGWIDFDFGKAFGRPTQIMNDAVMQALGSYRGGRMLFLGFGTGLGVVLVDKGRAYPLELPHVPYAKRALVQNYVGGEAKARLGRRRWAMNARTLIKQLTHVLRAEYVVIGGGNAEQIPRLPRHARVGGNDLAFIGGFRAWRRPSYASSNRIREARAKPLQASRTPRSSDAL